MSYSFRLYNDNIKSEVLLGVENSSNNYVINKINDALHFRNCIDECVPFTKNSKVAFVNFNALKYFLFGICELTIIDIIELEKLGFKLKKLNLSIFSTGLSKIFTSYYEDEIEEQEDLYLSDIFKSEKDIQYNMIKQLNISKDDLKYYKSKYGKFAKMNFSV